MKLIATKGRVDYYDGVCHQFRDENVLYIRKEEEITFSSIASPEKEFGKMDGRLYSTRDGFSFSAGLGKSLSLDYFIVGFCGKIYPGVHKTYRVYEYGPTGASNIVHEEIGFYFNAEDATSGLLATSRSFSKRYQNEFEKCSLFDRRMQIFSDKRLSAFFEDTKPDPIMLGLFDKHKCPVWSIESGVFTKNCLLKDFGFYTQFDSYQTYQVLMQYLCNIAVPMRPIPEISDEMKVATHGFNKESFRKPKQEQK